MIGINGGTYNPHTDRAGNLIALSNGGNVSTIYAYDGYGQNAAPANDASTGPAGYLYRYTGQRLDPNTGLYDYKARDYSPTLGRFIQPDPAGLDQGPNLYGYVGNDPVNGVDPSGHCLEDLCLGEAAVAVAACSANPGCRGIVGALFGGIVGSGSSAVKQGLAGRGVDGGIVAKEGLKGVMIGGVSAAFLNPHLAAGTAALVEGVDSAHDAAEEGKSPSQVASAGGVGALEAAATSYIGGKVAEGLSPVKFPTQEAISAAAGSAIAPIIGSGVKSGQAAGRHFTITGKFTPLGSRIPRPVTVHCTVDSHGKVSCS